MLHIEYIAKTRALLPPRNNLRNSMPDRCSGLLRLLLRQPTSHTHLQCWLWLPTGVPGVHAKTKREGLETGDEYTVGETLQMVSHVLDREEGNGIPHQQHHEKFGSGRQC
jgi:hypothetical protein